MSIEINNPIHRKTSTGPSKAYLESLENSRRNSHERVDMIDENQNKPSIGIKTLIVSLVLFFGGVIMFIIGCTFYFSSDGTEQHSQGLDILIVGSISMFLLFQVVV